MDCKIEKGFLVIKLPIEHRASKSGKSIVVATTGGNIPAPVTVDGKTVRVGVNAYIPA